jgi:hypothetical protein
VELKLDRRGRPKMPQGRLWALITAMALITGGLLFYVMEAESVRAWWVTAFLLGLAGVGVVFAVTAVRLNVALFRALPVEDRNKRYPVVSVRRLWMLLPVPTVVSGLSVWAATSDWLGFPVWNAISSTVWIPYLMLVFATIVSRRAGVQESSIPGGK